MVTLYGQEEVFRDYVASQKFSSYKGYCRTFKGTRTFLCYHRLCLQKV